MAVAEGAVVWSTQPSVVQGVHMRKSIQTCSKNSRALHHSIPAPEGAACLGTTASDLVNRRACRFSYGIETSEIHDPDDEEHKGRDTDRWLDGTDQIGLILNATNCEGNKADTPHHSCSAKGFRADTSQLIGKNPLVRNIPQLH
jgi:hypothetical protein